jgi:hypothetical protein
MGSLRAMAPSCQTHVPDEWFVSTTCKPWSNLSQFFSATRSIIPRLGSELELASIRNLLERGKRIEKDRELAGT